MFKNRLYTLIIFVIAVIFVVAAFYGIGAFYRNATAAAPTGHQAGHGAGSGAPQVTGTATPITPVAGCEVQTYNLASKGTGQNFTEPDVKDAKDPITITVNYASNKIAECTVNFRAYNGKLVGPTIKARPGDTLNITLVNSLQANSTDTGHVINTIGDLDHTNFHTHGLHVSPDGNSDNVLLDIAPQTSFEFEIKIPANHTPGTYWYHAHMHGSTATQIASGMEGALIILGDQVPNTVDSLPAVKAAAEKVFVLQQLIYDETGRIEPDAGGNAPLGSFPTLENQTTPPSQVAYFGPCSWEPMLREHTINGQMFPVLTMAPGEVQRWRLIDAAIRESIGLQLIGPYPADAKITSISDIIKMADPKKLIPVIDPKTGLVEPVAPGKFVTLHEIAVDGIALNKVDDWDQIELEPGYRSDVMVQLNDTGKYFLVDTGVIQSIVTRDQATGDYTVTTQSSLSLTCPNNNETPNLLATVMVSGTAKQMSLPTTSDMAKLPLPYQPIVEFNPVTTTLDAKGNAVPKPDAVMNAAGTAAEAVSPYSDNMLQPSTLDPKNPVEINGVQKVDFSVTIHPFAPTYPTPVLTLTPAPTGFPGALGFFAGDHSFDNLNHRRLKLGNTEEWILNTQSDSLYYAHPYHIHINPFQTMRWAPDRVSRELVWRDTVLVQMGIPSYVFTRYQDYIGSYVYHCHILDHEDQGMMEVVEVIP